MCELEEILPPLGWEKTRFGHINVTASFIHDEGVTASRLLKMIGRSLCQLLLCALRVAAAWPIIGGIPELLCLTSKRELRIKILERLRMEAPVAGGGRRGVDGRLDAKEEGGVR